MRLYKLVRRWGRTTSSFFKPPDDPLAVRPTDWAGWHWDMDILTWVPTSMPDVHLSQYEPEFPKPTESTRPAQDVIVPGWSWNGRTEEWEEVPMETITKWVMPERPPAPAAAPARGEPWDVLGWTWSPWDNVWLEVPMELIPVEFEYTRPPMPEYSPGEAVPDRVKGWVWDYGSEEWLVVIYAEKVDDYSPPLPPPPVDVGVDLDVVYASIGDWPAMAKTLIKLGFSEGDAWAMIERLKLQVDITPFVIGESIKHDFIRNLVSIWRRSHQISPTQAQMHWLTELRKLQRTYYESMRVANPTLKMRFDQLMRQYSARPRGHNLVTGEAYLPEHWATAITVQAVAFWTLAAAVTAAIGLLAGWLAQRLLFRDEQFVGLYPDIETYLVGPDDWLYASLAGCSLRAEPYFRSCDPIGAENAHHLRGEPWQMDRIAFTPGGFLEEGWHRGRFVKFRWEYWDIKYIGFLIRRGSSLYSLQDGYYMPGHPSAGYVVPVEYVCPEFRTYL